MIIMIGERAPESATTAFELAARSVLGSQTSVLVRHVETDPDDDQSAALGVDVDGVVELSWSEDRAEARLHCYLSREQRWVDREIKFGVAGAGAGAGAGGEREERERGRLLGFAVATMFTDHATSREPEPPVVPAARREPPAPTRARPTTGTQPSVAMRRRTLEFACIGSAGIAGTAGGLGAMAGARFAFRGPLSVRAFVAGRAGNMPEAQASTRTVQLGGGLALGFLPAESWWELGLRSDGIVSYFDVSHLSEDDAEPDRRQRWLGGADLIAEGGFRLTSSAGLHLGAGIEVMFGETAVFTRGARVAVVPPLRAVAELGFRTGF